MSNIFESYIVTSKIKLSQVKLSQVKVKYIVTSKIKLSQGEALFTIRVNIIVLGFKRKGSLLE